MTAQAPAPIPTTPLLATGPFGRQLDAERVAQALARGLRAGGAAAPDLCPLEPARAGRAGVQELLAALDFDARLRRARAVIVGERRLHEDTLAASAAFEIATRARQAGVPAYAVTAEDRLDLFDARVLDLQVILQATSARGLSAAGRKLARLL